LIGALYLDQGLERVAIFMEPRFERAAAAVVSEESLFDARSVLQMWAQAELGTTPHYRTVAMRGPDHAREFVVEVRVGEDVRAEGAGNSKQKAAQRAATQALENIGYPSPWIQKP
jgi:ribonuclease-3